MKDTDSNGFFYFPQYLYRYYFYYQFHCRFQDVQLSKDLMSEYKSLNANLNRFDRDAAGGENPDSVLLDVNVCTTGFWPCNKQIPTIKHPQELQPACEKFKRFYLHKHSGHKLEWRLDQGTAEITVDFNEQQPAQSRKALVCSTYQMMILLLFNNTKRVTYRQILDMTGIPNSEIANHLLTLCHPKVNILLKKPNGKKLEDDVSNTSHSMLASHLISSHRRYIPSCNHL
jgi:hypothetical protein